MRFEGYYMIAFNVTFVYKTWQTMEGRADSIDKLEKRQREANLGKQ